MRVIHYQQHFLGLESGTANSARGWCEALARSGVDVIVLTDAAMRGREPPDEVEVVALDHSGRGALRFPRRASAWIRGADVVVLHGGWLWGNIVVGRVCARLGVPFVVTTHGVYAPEVLRRRSRPKRVWAETLDAPHLRRALAVHVFFPEERDYLQVMGVRVPSIVAPNGVTFPEGVRWDGGSGGYLLWLGRFDPTTKGLDLLVRAVAEIPPADRPEIRLHGPDRRGGMEALRVLVRDLAVGGSVQLGDPVYGDEKWDLMRRAAGYIHPSRWDACPVSVAEAAAVGVPILVTRYPLGNFFAAEDAAIQVDPDPPSIAGGIRELTSPRAAAIGERAMRLARRSLTWDAVAESWMHQLDDALGRAGRPARQQP